MHHEVREVRCKDRTAQGSAAGRTGCETLAARQPMPVNPVSPNDRQPLGLAHSRKSGVSGTVKKGQHTFPRWKSVLAPFSWKVESDPAS